MTHAAETDTTDTDVAAEIEVAETPEPETSEAYWQRMADASTEGRHATHDTTTIGTVACPNPLCDRRGQWYRIPATHTGPLHCGGCYQVLSCDHTDTTTVTTYAGTMAAPLRADTTTCTACHQQISHKQTPITLDEVPLQLPLAVHNQ